MVIRSIDKIEDKIKELENRMRPNIKYDINNKETYIYSRNNFDDFNLLITQAKIDALQWCLSKKRKL